MQFEEVKGGGFGFNFLQKMALVFHFFEEKCSKFKKK